MKYTVELTDAENKALGYAAFSQQDWIENLVHERCRIAIEEIVQITAKHCLDNGIQIPATREDIVAFAFENALVSLAADRVST
jgi:hypothetical protein